MSKIDVMCVGDIGVDVFIKLIDGSYHSYANNYGDWLAFPAGSKVQYDFSEIILATGNAANASICLSRLGLTSALMSNVGGDNYGRDVLHYLQREEVDSRFIRVNPHKMTNWNYVLWYGDERTILTKHESYRYHFVHLAPMDKPRWIYLTSLGETALDFERELIDYLEENPDVKLAFQPGSVQLKSRRHSLPRIFKRAEVIIMNLEEAQRALDDKSNDVKVLLDKFKQAGAKNACITDGPNGAFVVDREGNYIKVDPFPDKGEPIDRTGAGDAFAATIVASLVKGISLKEALERAAVMAMSVVTQVGSHSGLLAEVDILLELNYSSDWAGAHLF
jgi:sugar/nucleoside kinase (ribokinase family)